MSKPPTPAAAPAAGDPPIDWANVASEVQAMLDLNHQGEKGEE